MTPQRWKQIDSLFNQALEIGDTAAREEYIARECQGDDELKSEVRALLASEEQMQAGFVEKQIEDGIADFGESETLVMSRQAGPYLLTKELGRGGMGTVYLG